MVNTIYDQNGNVVEIKNNRTGYTQKWTYNDQGKLISYKDSIGNKKWFNYCDEYVLIHEKDPNGFEKWYKR